MHGKVRTPVFGLVTSSVFVTALLMYGWNHSFKTQFEDVVLLATWMTLIAYAYAAAAELVLFFRERELFSWAKLARDSVIAAVAFAYSLWAIWGSGQEWLAKGFMLLLLGIPVFVWLKWRQAKQREVVDLRAFELQRPLPPPPKPPRRVPAGRRIFE